MTLSWSDMAEAFGREWNAARKAQGFRSQAHLDAFYAAFDHLAACGRCGQPGPAMWLEGSASYQPTETRCGEWLRLDALKTELGTSAA